MSTILYYIITRTSSLELTMLNFAELFSANMLNIDSVAEIKVAVMN